MNWLTLQSVAQVSIEHVLNSLPEGLLIAALAWLVLRLLGRQNSGTRFAVWFVALLAIAALPFLGAFTGGAALIGGIASPKITVPVSWAVILFAAWALAACSALVRLFAGLYRVRKMRAECRPVDLSQLDPSLAETILGFNQSRAVIVATSEQVRVPAALGFTKPMIVIPAWALRELSAEELRIILLHEFTHLRRRDDWTNLFQKAVRALFFFHPAVWWIDARLSLEREMACDDAVLAETSNPRAYANCLVSLLEKSNLRRGLAMAQAAVDRAREASLRIAQILSQGRSATTRVSKPALGLAGLFSVAGVVVLLCTPQLVVFDSGHASKSSYADAVTADQLSVPASALVPAAFHPDRQQHSVFHPAMLQTAQKPVKPALRSATIHRHRPVVQPTVVHSSSITHTGALPANAVHLASAPVRQPQIVAAGENQSATPAVPMVVLVETTQYVESGSSAWRVQTLRFFLVRPAQKGGVTIDAI